MICLYKSSISFACIRAEVRHLVGKGIQNMSKKPNVWVVHRPDNNWGVVREGGKKPSHVTRTQQEANDIARGIAINNQVNRITQGRDGHIVSHDSFGDDPCPPKDTEH
jgi:hypothetical protein